LKQCIAILLLAVGVALAAERGATFRPYKRPPAAPFPEEIRYNRERELLGRTLFFDPRLSGARNTSCATCHNSAWADLLFWDGRARSLEEQALGPMQSADEMNLRLQQIAHRISAIPGYRPLFERAYPDEPVTAEVVAKAIATFERTLVSGVAPSDRWAAGEQNAIPEEAKRDSTYSITKRAARNAMWVGTSAIAGFMIPARADRTWAGEPCCLLRQCSMPSRLPDCVRSTSADRICTRAPKPR